MSATIDYPMLKRELGLEDADTILIDLPSPFPVENRKVFLMNAYTLNRENMSDERTLMQVSSIVDSLMSKHPNEQGLILTTSYELAGNIFRYSNNKSRLLLTKDISAKEVLEKHARTNANVILTPTMWEGVDLKDDLCRFIIIAKTPYPSLADKRIKVKAERDKEWYRSVTLMRLIQGCGRGVRHDKDYCITYILDSNATWLIKGKVKVNAVPRWFKDALVYNNKNNS
jgi:Rad3-related DNA helicase